MVPAIEFAGLWKYITDWQRVFRHFDRDRSGSIEGRELAEALESFGYRLSPDLLRLIELKYGQPIEQKSISMSCWMASLASQPVTGYGPPPGITFDRFVRACVTVKTLTEAFQRCVNGESIHDSILKTHWSLDLTPIAMAGFRSTTNSLWMWDWWFFSWKVVYIHLIRSC